jgi:transposase
MLAMTAEVKVYVAIGATDMRKSINGLSLLVEEHFQLDLFSGSLFAFCNRCRNRVKILYWDRMVFCGSNAWSRSFPLAETESEVLEISRPALGWLLRLDLRRAHRRPHIAQFLIMN